MIETKKCSKCGEVKPLSEFYKNGNGVRPDCKVCCELVRKAYQKKNPLYYVNGRIKQRAARLRLKSGLSCSVCGESRPVALDFHHTNPEEKDGDISDMIKRVPDDRLEAELEKCIVLCASCHRVHHEELFLEKMRALGIEM